MDYWNWNQVFVIANSLKGGEVIDELPKDAIFVWEDLVEYLFADKKRMVSILNNCYYLVKFGIMNRSEKDYLTWYYIRKEYWEIMFEVGALIENPQKRIEENQKIVEESVAEDMNLVNALGRLIWLSKFDRTFIVRYNDDCMYCVFEQKPVGVLSWDGYREILKRGNSALTRVVMTNYLLTNGNSDVVTEVLDYVMEFDEILRELSRKADVLEAELLDGFEPPVQRVSDEKTYEVLKWLILLYRGMVKLDPCVMISRIMMNL
jgi:hypothetical protein